VSERKISAHFALAHKGYVEVVSAVREPARKVSYLVRSYPKYGFRDRETVWGTYKDWVQIGTTKRRLPVVSFTGHYKVLVSKPTRTFGKITGHTLKPGTIWRVDNETLAKLVPK
jgi:hypothetical protein